jgi:hypothetical protein
MVELKVWEIVAQREPYTDVDPVDVGALIRWVFPSLPNCLLNVKCRENLIGMRTRTLLLTFLI